MFSKTCEYALKTMIFLCSYDHEGKLVSLKDISGAIDSPEAFTAKILQQLVRSGLLKSLKGPTGGFKVSDRPITLLEVVTAIDGDGVLTDCVLGLKECSGKKPCAVHDKFSPVRDQLKRVLSTTQLTDVKKGVIKGNRFLKI